MHLLAMRLRNATALRLIGAWMVLVGHCPELLGHPPWMAPAWGHLGLGIFFSLSGYMVSLSAKRSRDAFDFALRRARRLAPAYLAASLGVVLLVWPCFGKLPASQVLRPGGVLRAWIHILASGAHWDLPGLFSTHAFTSANGSVWSLPYELLMYLGLGIAMFLCLRRSPRTSLSLTWTAWILATAVLLAGERFLPSGDFRFAGFRVLYALEFFALFAGGWALAETAWNWKSMGAAFLGVALLRFLLRDWPQAYALDGILLPLAVVGIGHIGEAPARSTVPDISYGFYLWAWPVQQCLVDRFPHLSPITLMAWATTATLPLSAASWFFVERPFLRRSNARMIP